MKNKLTFSSNSVLVNSGLHILKQVIKDVYYNTNTGKYINADEAIDFMNTGLNKSEER